MTKSQLNKIKKALETREQEIAASLGDRSDLQVQQEADDVDNTIGAANRDLSVICKNKMAGTLREIRAALVRIEEGTYGVCIECEENIPQKRLDAVMSASRCIKCQEAHDRAVASGEIEEEEFAVAAA